MESSIASTPVQFCCAPCVRAMVGYRPATHIINLLAKWKYMLVGDVYCDTIAMFVAAAPAVILQGKPTGR